MKKECRLYIACFISKKEKYFSLLAYILYL